MKDVIKWAMEGKVNPTELKKWVGENRTELMISFRPYETADAARYEKLIEEAAQDQFLGDFVKKHKREDFVGFFSGKNLVGFAIPRKDSDGHYRTGAIFVTADRRRDGIASAFVKQYFEGKKGRAFIEPHNTASIALYTSVGFKKTGKQVKHDGDELDEYLKEE